MADGAPYGITPYGTETMHVLRAEKGYPISGQGTDGTGTPLDPEKFVADFAAALEQVVSDPARAREMGEAGRVRAEANFSWETIGASTIEVYRSVL